MKRRDALIALSLANLCYLAPWSRYLSIGLLLEGRPPTRVDYLGIVFDVLLTAACLYGGASWLRRAGGRWLAAGKALVVVLLCVPAFAVVQLLVDDQLFRAGAWLKAHIAMLGLTLAVALLLRRQVWWLIRSGLLIASPFVVLSLGQAALGFARAPWRLPEPAHASPATRGGARVLWIIFDELDERLLFRERPAGIAMPEFDRLRDVSVRGTNAYPPGRETVISTPALTTGRIATKAGFNGAIRLVFEDAPDAPPVDWRDTPTVFSRASGAGYEVRAVGWALGYCTLFSKYLNACVNRPTNYSLHSHDPVPTVANSMAANALALLPWNTRRLHRNDFSALFAAAREMAADSTPGLLFVHLPVPHPPGIYDRSRGTTTAFDFSGPSGYLDNLVLTDRVLGEIRRDMEATGEWDRTSVIVSADHWWRSSEDYDGRMDHRVPFLLKPAGSHQAIAYETPFNTVLTQALVLALLDGQVTSADSAVQWVTVHKGSEVTPDYDRQIITGF